MGRRKKRLRRLLRKRSGHAQRMYSRKNRLLTEYEEALTYKQPATPPHVQELMETIKEEMAKGLRGFIGSHMSARTLQEVDGAAARALQGLMLQGKIANYRDLRTEVEAYSHSSRVRSSITVVVLSNSLKPYKLVLELMS